MTLSAGSSSLVVTSTTGFAVAVGGVAGRDHRRARRDGQDGFARIATPAVTAAIVTDGCSSGAASEVGARLGAAWLADLIADRFPGNDPGRAAIAVTEALVERLRATARSLSSDGTIDASAVGEMLLFGFLAAVVTREHAVVFGVGDGIVWVDARATAIDPGPENAPPYAAYALLGATIAPSIHHVSAAADVEAIAIATDGAAELLVPGAASSLETFIRDDRLLANPSLLRRRLIALEDRGHFWDDATVGVVRRA